MRLKFDITRQDYADFNQFHFIKTKLKMTIARGVLTILILQLFLNREKFDLTPTIISSIFCVFAYVFTIKRSLNKTKNIPDKDGTILGQKEIEFVEDKITYRTKNSEGSSAWTTVKKLEESTNAFYLYMDTNMAMIVPKRSFKDKGEEDAFKKLALQKTNTI